MTLNIRLRLSGMMFLNYAIWGFWFVTIWTYMEKTLGFDNVGFIFGNYALAAMVSPFFVGMVADRFFSTEKVLAVLHLLGAVFMFLLTTIDSYWPFFTVLLCYNLLFMPTIALTNSLCFHHMSDREKEFPTVRVLGTIAWILVGLLIGFMKWETSTAPFYVAAGVSVLMGLYCFTLPHTPPKGKGEKVGYREILGLDALSLMKNRSFATVIISSFLISIPLAFYYGLGNIYLFEQEVPNPTGLQTMGQMSEIFFLLVLPFLFARYGMKMIMAVGMLAWSLRYLLFALGYGGTIFADGGGISGFGSNTMWMIYVGILLHGICYDFFFVAGQIYVDQKSPEALKSSAQGFITFVTYGLGMYIGTILSGIISDTYKATEGCPPESCLHDWWPIWIIPAVFSAIVLIGFFLSFRETKNQSIAENQAANLENA